MVDTFVQTFLSSPAGVLGFAGICAVILLALAWLIPPTRPFAVAAIAAIITLATIYTKGSRDRAKLEAKRREEAVRKAQDAYDKINKRNDTTDSVRDRLKRGDF